MAESEQLESIAPGIPAPNFTLQSATGERVRLSDFGGKKHIVLFFMRAFNCIQCREFVRRLAETHPAFEEQNAVGIVIGPGTRQEAERLHRGVTSKGGQLIVLYDGSGEVYDSYILNKVFFSLLQKSAAFVLDKEGTVRYAHATANAMRWLAPQSIEQILDSLRLLNVPPAHQE